MDSWGSMDPFSQDQSQSPCDSTSGCSGYAAAWSLRSQRTHGRWRPSAAWGPWGHGRWSQWFCWYVPALSKGRLLDPNSSSGGSINHKIIIYINHPGVVLVLICCFVVWRYVVANVVSPKPWPHLPLPSKDWLPGNGTLPEWHLAILEDSFQPQS